MPGFVIYLRDLLLRKEFQSNAKISDKTVIITGGNTGIGKEVAFDLAARGAKVIIACRDTQKGRVAAEDIRNQISNASVDVKCLNLASFYSIRRFAEEILMTEPYVHILINNAGLAGCKKSKTVEGFELHFGVNYLGHFLLTNLLLERIKASAPARIVNVGSISHMIGKIHFSDIHLERAYHPFLAYSHSKLSNILFNRELSRRLKGTGVTTYCVDPGPSHTDISRYLVSENRFMGCFLPLGSRLLFKSPKQGAQTTIYCAVEETLSEESGLYYCALSEVRPSLKATDDSLARRLWNFSENLIASVE